MTDTLSTSPEAERATWQYRAVLACQGNQTRRGCVLLAVIGKPARHPPCFGPSALITPEGYVLSAFVNRAGQTHKGAMVNTVEGLRSEWNRLADEIGATPEERNEMFDELRRWVAHDYRLLTRRKDEEIEAQGLKNGGLW